MFCFISGYLAYGRRPNPLGWIIKRYFSIMVPYWMVLIPVLFANHIEHYKPTSLFSALVTIAGGNMFLSNAVYVIAWYITFILLLYFYGYLETFFRSYRIIIPMLIGTLVFTFWFKQGFYFLSFLVGLRICDWKSKSSSIGAPRSSDLLSIVFFHIQKYCYPFFLVHGAVLLALVMKTHLPSAAILAFALIASCICSVVVYVLAKPVQKYATSRTLGLVERMRIRLAPR